MTKEQETGLFKLIIEYEVFCEGAQWQDIKGAHKAIVDFVNKLEEDAFGDGQCMQL